MANTSDKYTVSHKNHMGQSLSCVWAALSGFYFPSKRHEFWTYDILLHVGFRLGSDRKERLSSTVT